MTQFEDLLNKLKDSYVNGITMPEAERLAGEFLHAQLVICEQLRVSDLDARMKKAGLKAIRAAVYLENATKTDKKPSDAMLEAFVNRDTIVLSEQEALDNAEVDKNALENYLSIFKDGHIHFRTISKGAFNG